MYGSCRSQIESVFSFVSHLTSALLFKLIVVGMSASDRSSDDGGVESMLILWLISSQFLKPLKSNVVCTVERLIHL